jgi:hypothetical protein
MSTEIENTQRPARRSAGSYVSLSYRYLRLGMAIMVGLIFVSVLIQAAHEQWSFLGSISEYYYTPAQFVFVASLVAIGVCLIVIRGHDVWEDGLLNLAGMFAAVVAIVPTPETGDCFAPPADVTNPLTPNVENNLLTYLLVGSAVLAGAVAAAIRARRAAADDRARADVSKRYVVLALTVLLAAAGWWIFYNAWDFVALCAHPISAMSMFGCMVLVVVLNAKASDSTAFTRGYGLIVALMLVGGAAIVLGRSLWYGHWVLALETWEILLFAVFWLLQTIAQDKQAPPEFDRSPVRPATTAPAG